MIKMVEEYLESKVKEVLIERGLVKPGRIPVYYTPKEGGETYRKLTGKSRQFIYRNVKKISIGGLALAGAIGYSWNSLLGAFAAGGIGTASLLGLTASTGKFAIPLDRIFLRNPGLIARGQFRDLVLPWDDAYDSIRIKDKTDLDSCVLMIKSPESINSEYGYEYHQRTLGIAASRVIDSLSDISKNGGLSGLKLEHIIEMTMDQKVEIDGNRIEFSKILKIPFKGIANYVKKKDSDIPEESLSSIQVLRDILQNYEFTLSIPRGYSDGLCAQLSRGHCVARDYTGINAFAYAGLHSVDLDLPRITVKGSTGHSFMTKAKRGLGIVQGKSEHKFLEGCTGGIAIARGEVEGMVRGANDLTYPVIGISGRGFTEEPEDGDNNNALIISLNRNILTNKPPYSARFKDGKIDKRIYNNVREAEEKAGELIREYIMEWQPRVA